MQVFPNPDNPIWTQANTTDLFGNLYATRNINLERQGYIGLSKRTSYIPSTVNNTITSMAYNPLTATYRGIVSGTGSGMLNVSPVTLSMNANADSNSNLNDNSSRIIYWNNTLYYSRSNALKKLTAGVYSDVLALTTTTTVTHCLCSFENKVLLAIGDGNIVRTLTTADVAGATLTLPIQYSVNWIKYFGNKLYIGTENKTGANGMMFIWDGSSSEASFGYPFYSYKAIGAEFIESTIYALNLKGQLLQFTGGGFTEVASLPFRIRYNNSWITSSNENSISVLDNTLIMGIDNRLQDGNGLLSTSAFVDNFYDGVWSYTPTHGLVHKFSETTSTSDFGLGWSQGNLITIFPFIESNISGQLPDKSLGSRLFISYSTGIGTRTLLSLTTGENRGHFQTKKIVNTNSNNVNKKLFLKYRNVDDSNDKIVLKYKEKDVSGLPNTTVISATFTNQNTFTSTDTVFANVQVGYEVQLLLGGFAGGNSNSGVGSLAHIVSLSNVSGTYTVVLDENVVGTSPSSTFYLKVDNFIKLMTIDSTTDPIDNTVEIPINVTSKWISIKVEMRGEDVEIEQVVLVEEVSQPAK